MPMVNKWMMNEEGKRTVKRKYENNKNQVRFDSRIKWNKSDNKKKQQQLQLTKNLRRIEYEKKKKHKTCMKSQISYI